MKREILEKNFRRTVVGVERQVPLINGNYTTAINFDNAATTPPFCAVIREIENFVPWYSSVHRGTGYKSMVSSDIYEEGRQIIQRFVGADPTQDILIYTKSTTEAINILANAISQCHPDAIILSSRMEHLANDLPWRSKFCMDYIQLDENGRLDLTDLEEKLKKYQGKVKLVTITGASNVTGYRNPIHTIAGIAHRYGAEILVDGAQLVPHCAVEMKPHSSTMHIDYLVFSAHKMYAPFGIGVLIGKGKTFQSCIPNAKGGGAVKLVTHEFVDWDDPPYREEAGTPNVIGVAALLKAIDCLERMGMEKIHVYEQQLIDYIIGGLKEIPGIRLYGCPKKQGDKVSIITFTLPKIGHRLVAKILSYEYGIAVRSGLFCAHPYIQDLLGMNKAQIEYYRENPALEFPGMVRVSLGLYNDQAEADRLIEGVRYIADNSIGYNKKYQEIDHLPMYASSPLLHPIKRQLP